MASLSVVISTKDHAYIVENALKSVAFADEIIVIDMQSTDNTLEIVKKYTNNIYQCNNVGFIEPVRNFSLSKTTQDWVLILDADEEVSIGLKKLIKGILASSDQDGLADCFYLPRKNIIFNQWIKKTGWWPDKQLRLFKRGSVEWLDQIHSIPLTKGDVKELPPKEKIALIHHNYQTIEQFIERMNRYSMISAQENQNDEVTEFTIFEAFTSSFFSRFFVQQGIKEGIHGLSLSLLQAISDAAVQMKIWQLHQFPASEVNDQQLDKQFKKFSKEFHYYLADWQVKRSKGLLKFYWRIRRKLMI